MADFELGVINAVRDVFGANVTLLACFFHLCQNVFRAVQRAGLQREYNDEQDSTIRDAVRRMCALAFVPPRDVIYVFEKFVRSAPRTRKFTTIVDYFRVR